MLSDGQEERVAAFRLACPYIVPVCPANPKREIFSNVLTPTSIPTSARNILKHQHLQASRPYHLSPAASATGLYLPLQRSFLSHPSVPSVVPPPPCWNLFSLNLILHPCHGIRHSNRHVFSPVSGVKLPRCKGSAIGNHGSIKALSLIPAASSSKSCCSPHQKIPAFSLSITL